MARRERASEWPKYDRLVRLAHRLSPALGEWAAVHAQTIVDGMGVTFPHAPRDAAMIARLEPWFDRSAAAMAAATVGSRLRVHLQGSGYRWYGGDPDAPPQKTVEVEVLERPKLAVPGMTGGGVGGDLRVEVRRLDGKSQLATLYARRVGEHRATVLLINRDAQGAHTAGHWVHVEAPDSLAGYRTAGGWLHGPWWTGMGEAGPPPSWRGGGQYMHLVRGPNDPERMTRAERRAMHAATEGQGVTAWRGDRKRGPRGEETDPVGAWKAAIRELLADDQPRTFNAIVLTLTGNEYTADVMGDSAAEKAVWEMVGDWELAHTLPTERTPHVLFAIPYPPEPEPEDAPGSDWPDRSNPPRCAEAFAGGGLYGIGLRAEGWEAVELCELDAAAVETLRREHGDLAHVCDASEWTPPPGLDLLTGGPPCQPWSQGGKLRGPADERNFYPRLVGWIRDSRPRVFAWENSSKIASVPRFRAYFDEWWKAVDAAGYEGVVWTLNAADYGSPQRRLRAWVVGWPKGAPWGEALRSAPPPTHGRPGTPAVESGALLPWTRAFDRLVAGCCGGYGLHDCARTCNDAGACETCTSMMGSLPVNYAPAQMTDDAELSDEARDYLARMKKGGSSQKDKPRVFAHPPTPFSGEAWDALGIKDRRVTGYLSPVMVKNLVKGAPYGLIATDATPPATDIDRDDPEQMARYIATLRRISPRSAAKLMDVPNWYDFAGGPQRAYEQIGNGITVNMGRAVARHIAAALGWSTPIAGSPAEEGRWGLWAMDAVDPCASFPGIRGRPGEHFPGSVPLRTDFDPRARPYDSPESWIWAKGGAAAAREALEAWGFLDDEVPDDEYQHDYDWRPADGRDYPPGFPDRAYFMQWIYGEDEDVLQHYDRIYREVGTPLLDNPRRPSADELTRAIRDGIRRLPAAARARLAHEGECHRTGGCPPEHGLCYPAAELLWHAAGGPRSGLRVRRLVHEGTPHWYVEGGSGRVFDPTAGQYRRAPDYARGASAAFLTRRPSRRARELAQLLARGARSPTPSPPTRRP